MERLKLRRASNEGRRIGKLRRTPRAPTVSLCGVRNTKLYALRSVTYATYFFSLSFRHIHVYVYTTARVHIQIYNTVGSRVFPFSKNLRLVHQRSHSTLNSFRLLRPTIHDTYSALRGKRINHTVYMNNTSGFFCQPRVVCHFITARHSRPFTAEKSYASAWYDVA